MPTIYKRKHDDKYNRKPVYQYTMEWVFIKEWPTVGVIYRELGLDKSAILRCCKKKQKRSYWYHWRFKEDVLKEKQLKDKSQAS